MDKNIVNDRSPSDHSNNKKKPQESAGEGAGTNKYALKVAGILEWSCIFFLFVQVVVVVMVVFGRFVLGKTPVWGEEIALLAMIWLSLFSADLGEINSAHINIALIDKVLPKLAKKIRDIFFHILNAGFSLILTYEGFSLMLKVRHAVMPGSKLPLWLLYLSVPLSSAFLFLSIIKKLIKGEA